MNLYSLYTTNLFVCDTWNDILVETLYTQVKWDLFAIYEIYTGCSFVLFVF